MAPSINIRSAGEGWRAVGAPTPQRPYWHELEDESHVHLPVLLAAVTDSGADIADLHGEAIATITRAALAARAAGDTIGARRLSNAAARLCGEIIGLWAPSTASRR